MSQLHSFSCDRISFLADLTKGPGILCESHENLGQSQNAKAHLGTASGSERINSRWEALKDRKERLKQLKNCAFFASTSKMPVFWYMNV
jgi:hypothetical protein